MVHDVAVTKATQISCSHCGEQVVVRDLEKSEWCGMAGDRMRWYYHSCPVSAGGKAVVFESDYKGVRQMILSFPPED